MIEVLYSNRFDGDEPYLSDLLIIYLYSQSQNKIEISALNDIIKLIVRFKNHEIACAKKCLECVKKLKGDGRLFEVIKSIADSNLALDKIDDDDLKLLIAASKKYSYDNRDELPEEKIPFLIADDCELPELTKELKSNILIFLTTMEPHISANLRSRYKVGQPSRATDPSRTDSGRTGKKDSCIIF